MEKSEAMCLTMVKSKVFNFPIRKLPTFPMLPSPLCKMGVFIFPFRNGTWVNWDNALKKSKLSAPFPLQCHLLHKAFLDLSPLQLTLANGDLIFL